jgi:hypothetical protein
MRHSILRWLYSGICAILAVVGFGLAFEGLRTWRSLAAASMSFMGALSVVFALTSVSLLRNWRVGRWLAGATGLLLALYALSVVLLGWEDVGGAPGAIPLSVGTGLAGGLGILVAVSGADHRGLAV